MQPEGYHLAQPVADLFETAPSDVADTIYRFVRDHEQTTDDLARELENALGVLEWAQSEGQNHLVAGLTSLLNELPGAGGSGCGSATRNERGAPNLLGVSYGRPGSGGSGLP